MEPRHQWWQPRRCHLACRSLDHHRPWMLVYRRKGYRPDCHRLLAKGHPGLQRMAWLAAAWQARQRLRTAMPPVPRRQRWHPAVLVRRYAKHLPRPDLSMAAPARWRTARARESGAMAATPGALAAMRGASAWAISREAALLPRCRMTMCLEPDRYVQPLKSVQLRRAEALAHWRLQAQPPQGLPRAGHPATQAWRLLQRHHPADQLAWAMRRRQSALRQAVPPANHCRLRHIPAGRLAPDQPVAAAARRTLGRSQAPQQ